MTECSSHVVLLGTTVIYTSTSSSASLSTSQSLVSNVTVHTSSVRVDTLITNVHTVVGNGSFPKSEYSPDISTRPAGDYMHGSFGGMMFFCAIT